jgi:hypothetical protein
LLRTGSLVVDVRGTHFEKICRDAKMGLLDVDEGLQLGAELEAKIETAEAGSVIPEEPDTESINKFIVKMRLKYLSPESVGVAMREHVDNVSHGRCTA